MTRFLTLKHWQLFGLLIGLPMVFQLTAIGSVVANNNPTASIYFFSILMVLFVGLFFGWFYALGTNFHKRLPPIVKVNLSQFKIFIFVPTSYILFFSIYMANFLSNFLNGEQPDFSTFLFIFPFHLFSMFCIFSCIYFIAKAFKSIESQKPVTFSDFAGEFLLILLFPLGIWVIQPKINKIFNTSTETFNI